MGTMGPGVFDNDAALDMLDATERIPLSEIQGFLASTQSDPEHIDTVVACVAIHAALVRSCGASPPSIAVADEVRDKVMRLFDLTYDDLKPQPGFKPQRRAILVETLNNYRALAA